MTKYLCIDYGEARVGLAVSDNGLIARPLKTIVNNGWGSVIHQIRDLMKLNGFLGKDTVIVIGEIWQKFGERLRQEFGLPVCYQSELLTSKMALEIIHQSGTRNYSAAQFGRKGILLDTVSACVILQTYLDAKNKKEGE